MLFPELEERMHHARHALDHASSDNIIELCTHYLTLLDEYRTELYNITDTLGVNQWAGSFLWGDVDEVRKAIRTAIENITRERNGTETLLHSFTSVSGYEAVETFNRQKYKGYDDWELRAGGVVRYSGDIAGQRMGVQEAVDTAGLLRREEHIARSAASAGVSRTTCHDISPAAPHRVSEGSAR